jgi:hypothetical protein
MLQVDIIKFFREDLQKKLLSPDFKKQIDGLDLLQRVCLLPATWISQFKDDSAFDPVIVVPCRLTSLAKFSMSCMPNSSLSYFELKLLCFILCSGYSKSN